MCDCDYRRKLDLAMNLTQNYLPLKLDMTDEPYMTKLAALFDESPER